MANRNFTQFTDAGGSFNTTTSYLVGYNGTDEKRITVQDFFCVSRPLTGVFGESNTYEPYGNTGISYRLPGFIAGCCNVVKGLEKYVFGSSNRIANFYGDSYSNSQRGQYFVVGNNNKIHRRHASNEGASVFVGGRQNTLSGGDATAFTWGGFNNQSFYPRVGEDYTYNYSFDNGKGINSTVIGDSNLEILLSGHRINSDANRIFGDSNRFFWDGSWNNDLVGWASNTTRNYIIGHENSLSGDRCHVFGTRNTLLCAAQCTVFGRDNTITAVTKEGSSKWGQTVRYAFAMGFDNTIVGGDGGHRGFAFGSSNRIGLNDHSYFGVGDGGRWQYTFGLGNTAIGGYASFSFGGNNIHSGFYNAVIGSNNDLARELTPSGGTGGMTNSLTVGVFNRQSGFSNNTIGNSVIRNSGVMTTFGAYTTSYGNTTFMRGVCAFCENVGNSFFSIANSHVRGVEHCVLFGKNVSHNPTASGNPKAEKNLFGVCFDSDTDDVGIWPYSNGSGPGTPGIRPWTRSNQATLSCAGGVYIPAQAGKGGLGIGIDTMSTATSAVLHVNAAGTIIFANLPTSSAGLPTGALWSNSGVLTVA